MVNQHIVMVDGSTNFNGDTFAFAMRHDKPVLVTYMQDHHMHKEEWRVNEPLLYSLWEVNPPIIYDNPLTILGGTTWMMGKSILEIIVPKTNLRLENMSGPLTTMLYLHRFFDTDIRLGLFLVLALNIDLVMFNLIPIYPMDGSHVVSALLNKRPKWLGSYKTCMYFATWMMLLLLTWMLILDVIKFNIL
jgi:hypothetical protein